MRWTAFWRAMVRFDASKVAPRLALRNTLGVAIPLAAGFATGKVSGGVVAALGALNVSYSDGSDPYGGRARRMLASSVLVAVAVFAGALSGWSSVAAVLLSATWAFMAGMPVALGTDAANIGMISLVTLIVFAARPLPPDQAALSGMLAFGGGLLQMGFALALWPVRRYRPEQRALGGLYLELSREAGSESRPLEAPPASAQSSDAQKALAALAGDHAIESERYVSLLHQAERIRLGLLVLSRLRTRLRRENLGQEAAETLDRFFDISSRVLGSIGNSLIAAEAAGPASGWLRQLSALTEELPEGVPAPIRDARSQMDAVAGQLRSAAELATSATPAGNAAFERREATRRWTLRLGGPLATLRANLRLQSAAFRHAVRLAACVALGTAVGRGFDVRRSYWIPMTIAIVLKPDFTATFSRGVLRLAGTFIGLVFATALFHVLPPASLWDAALIAILVFVLRCLGPANYGILVTAVTSLIVLLIAITGVSPGPVIAARAVNTVAGGALALLAYLIWPTWERTQVAETMARMLDCYRDYFHAVANNLSESLDRTRLGARLARTNAEASMDRLIAEPGVPAQLPATLSGMLASSHRFVHAVMALEAALSAGHSAAAGESFQAFARDVELTLYFLAAMLRGSPISTGDLPRLRERHNALIQSSPRTEQHTLVNVETDRITNSLNTLAEQIAQWRTARNAA